MVGTKQESTGSTGSPSVKLFSVVDLPLLGFPTSAIKGSRGILGDAMSCASMLQVNQSSRYSSLVNESAD